MFASASETWMEAVHGPAAGVRPRATFARNRLAVIVPSDDPAGIGRSTTSAEPGVKLVLAAVGRSRRRTYAREVLDGAGIAEEAEANVVSNEEDVKAVVQKVVLGEADAGIVYATDLTPDISSPPFGSPDPRRRDNVIATYPDRGDRKQRARDPGRAFVEYVTGARGRTPALSSDSSRRP